MKKRYIPLLALLFVASILPAQALFLPYLEDSVSINFYDNTTGEVQGRYFAHRSYNADNVIFEDYFLNSFWGINVYYHSVFEYNAEKLLSGTLLQGNETGFQGPWQNVLRDQYTYDSQDRNTFYLSEIADENGDWENYERETYSFNDPGKSDAALFEFWENFNWVNDSRYTNYYSANDELVHYNEDVWNETEVDWDLRLNNDYTYYPDGKLLTQNLQTYETNLTLYERQDSFLYRNDGQIDSIFSKSLYIPGGSVNNTVAAYEYNSSEQLVRISIAAQVGNTPIWITNSIQTFVPGDGIYSNDAAVERQLYYDASVDSFVVNSEIQRAFTPLSNSRVLYREELKSLNSNYELITQYVDSIWYRLPSAVNVHTPAAPLTADCQFANPFSAGDCIVCQSADQNSVMSLRITNLSGQLVARNAVMPGENWRPNVKLPAGTYFLTAWQSGKYLGQKKMVIR